MSALNYTRVYQSRIKKFWVIEHQRIEKPFMHGERKIRQCTTSRLFLTKTGLKSVRDQLNNMDL